MTDYLTEQEQIDAIKKWLKQYSGVIISGIILALLITTGIRYWQDRQARIASHASAIYDELISLRSQNDQPGTLAQATKLYKHYPQLVYGQMAALMLARNAAATEHYQEARTLLNWTIDKTKIASIKQIAKLRLARLDLAEKKPQAALNDIAKMEDKAFKGLIEEVQGDAYLALNDPKKARQFYQLALTDLPNAQTARPLLQMKFDNLT